MEIAVLLVIALVVFGPKRLPELGNSLGRGIREFRGSISGEATTDSLDADLSEPPTGATASATGAVDTELPVHEEEVIVDA